jgi:hypothetical protein
MPQAHNHHYVPQWYQKRFLEDKQSKYWLYDLRPDLVISGGGKRYHRNSILNWGPSRCFRQDDLYTVKLGTLSTDEVETRFFGPIDANGKSAVEFFSDYKFRAGAHDAIHNLILYMDAQRIRTPRGLDWLSTVTDLQNHNLALITMQKVFRMNATMWMEGVWEIVSAKQSKTKFIVSDQPITFYNAKAFPASASCKYPYDVGIDEVGTRTIFPLDMDKCLILSHLQLTRDPHTNLRRPRANARFFQATMMSFLDIQYGRELEENEVIRINYILKSRASRYIAAAEEEWLFPERRLQSTHWSKLDDDWFLFPNLYKVPFTNGMVVGYKDGSSWAMDEYGRNPGHPMYEDRKQRDLEWDRCQKAKLEWAIKRRGRSIAHVHESRHDAAEDQIMHDQLKKHGESVRKGHSKTDSL